MLNGTANDESRQSNLACRLQKPPGMVAALRLLEHTTVYADDP